MDSDKTFKIWICDRNHVNNADLTIIGVCPICKAEDKKVEKEMRG